MRVCRERKIGLLVYDSWQAGFPFLKFWNKQYITLDNSLTLLYTVYRVSVPGERIAPCTLTLP